MNNFKEQFIEKWNKIYTVVGRFYPFRLFAGVKHKEPFIPHDFRHCKTYEDFKKEGALFLEIEKPIKYYTLEPNPQAERIEEKDLPKDKLYYVWIAQKMLPDKFYKIEELSKDGTTA